MCQRIPALSHPSRSRVGVAHSPLSGSSTGPSVTTWFRMCVNVSGDSVRVPPPEGDTSMGYEPALSGRPHIGASSGGERNASPSSQQRGPSRIVDWSEEVILPPSMRSWRRAGTFT
jgi:hypothetical protein